MTGKVRVVQTVLIAMAWAMPLTLQAAGSPIDLIELNTFAHRSQRYEPSSLLRVIGEADVYRLHNGTSWVSGAGHGFDYFARISSVNMSGDKISYTLDLPVGEPIYNFTDYDTGEHSSNGRLVSTAPLVLMATSGSSVANLSGFARITLNQPENVTDNRFHYFNAPIGYDVPFSANYTLRNITWSPTTFDTSFDYNLAGTLNFAAAVVPEPGMIAGMAAAGLLLGCRRCR